MPFTWGSAQTWLVRRPLGVVFGVFAFPWAEQSKLFTQGKDSGGGCTWPVGWNLEPPALKECHKLWIASQVAVPPSKCPLANRNIHLNLSKHAALEHLCKQNTSSIMKGSPARQEDSRCWKSQHYTENTEMQLIPQEYMPMLFKKKLLTKELLWKQPTLIAQSYLNFPVPKRPSRHGLCWIPNRGSAGGKSSWGKGTFVPSCRNTPKMATNGVLCTPSAALI